MALIDDEINDIKLSIAEQLRITEAELVNMNTAMRGREKIESEIERLQRTIVRLEEREAVIDEKITETEEKLARTKNNQRTRMRLGDQLIRQLDISYSITREMERAEKQIAQNVRRVSNIDGIAGDIATRIALGGGNEAALNENLNEALREKNKQIREMTRLHKEALRDDEKRTREAKSALAALRGAAMGVVLAFSQIIQEGIQLARVVGESRSGGVGLDIANRFSSIFQLAGPDAFATRQQMQMAQEGLITTMVGTREGFKLTADAARGFVQNLNKGFGTEFEMTSGALRALITTGMSTRAEFDKFRKSTGLANLSSRGFEQLVSKNTLSFMLYGNVFAKTARDAERLGISLSAVQSAQESLVTNLDGTLDTVAQLNQLGSQVDFGTLVSKLEFEGPQATLKYLQRTIPPNLFQAASTRALVRQLGIPLEDLMKGAGSTQEQAAKSIESQMTEVDKGTSVAAKALVFLQNSASAVTLGFGGLIGATAKLIIAFRIAAATSGTGSIVKNSLGFGSKAAPMQGPKMVGAAGAGRIGAGMLAGMGTGLSLGAVAATLGIVGLLAGGTYLGYRAYKNSKAEEADDMVSSGYGSRTIVSPKGTIALNNSDTVVAGTNLGRGSDNGDLIRKIEELIVKLNDASTVIEVGGQRQRVSRLALVGVNSRYEVE